MFEIIIDVQNYFGNKEIFTVSDEIRSGLIIHEKGDFNDTEEVDRKTISKADFDNIVKAFSEVNFTEVFNEHEDLVGLDGWILTCTIKKGTVKISAQVWCPDKNESMPETTKLLEACELVCPVLELEEGLEVPNETKNL